MFEIASPAVYKPYYEQIDWRNRDVKQSSLTLGALWALELLTLYGDAGANERCESCNKGGDLLACSFCNVVYHNTPACLGSNVLKRRLRTKTTSGPAPNASRSQSASSSSQNASRLRRERGARDRSGARGGARGGGICGRSLVERRGVLCSARVSRRAR